MPAKRARPSPRLVLRRVTLKAQSGELRLGVVADTHSQPHPATLERLRGLAPDAILHAGDIGELSVLAPLAELAPLYAVRGNIDARAQGLPDVIVVDVRDASDPFFATTGVASQAAADIGEGTSEDDAERASASPPLLRFLLLHIAVAGPRLRAEVVKLAAEERASLVVCGHSHVPFIGRDRGVAMFNPGSVGPRRFALPIVLGAITISGGRARLMHIDCETGAPWSPP